MSDKTGEIEQSSNIPQNKGPFIGIILFLIGIIIIIVGIFSNLQINTSKTTIEATVSYASILKPSEDGTTQIQNINVEYTYNNKKYETGIKDIINGNYQKYDTVKIDINPNNPIDISIHGQNNNSGKFSKIFCGIIFIVLGILLFFGIISFENMGYRFWKLKRTLFGNKKPEDEQKTSLLSTLTGLVDKFLGGTKN